MKAGQPRFPTTLYLPLMSSVTWVGELTSLVLFSCLQHGANVNNNSSIHESFNMFQACSRKYIINSVLTESFKFKIITIFFVQFRKLRFGWSKWLQLMQVESAGSTLRSSCADPQAARWLTMPGEAGELQPRIGLGPHRPPSLTGSATLPRDGASLDLTFSTCKQRIIMGSA